VRVHRYTMSKQSGNEWPGLGGGCICGESVQVPWYTVSRQAGHRVKPCRVGTRLLQPLLLLHARDRALLVDASVRDGVFGMMVGLRMRREGPKGFLRRVEHVLGGVADRAEVPTVMVMVAAVVLFAVPEYQGLTLIRVVRWGTSRYNHFE